MARTLKISSLKPYILPQTNLLEQLPLRALAEAGWQVRWNDEVEECDAWLVLDGVSSRQEASCAPKNTLFVSAEPSAYKRYNEAWLAGFHRISSCQSRIRHPGLELGHAPLPWFPRRSLSTLLTEASPAKTAPMSTVCSSRHNMLGHNRRLRTLKHLQRKLPGKIEWYGRKIRFIDDKWDGLAPFHFSLAIENSREAGYWTEKFSDCLLSRTIPLYDGAPDISNYFPKHSYIPINTDDPDSVLIAVQTVLDNPEVIYKRMLPSLEEARSRFLEQHSFGARLLAWCQTFESGLAKERIIIDPEPELPWIQRKITKFRRRWLGTT